MNWRLYDSIKRLHHVQRWNGRRIISHRRSVSEHTLEVISVAQCLMDDYENTGILIGENPYLTSEMKLNVLEYALVHDISEAIIGDVPYVVKVAFPELKSTLDKVEDSLVLDLGINSDRWLDISKFTVKVADNIVVGVEILEEIQAGNPSKEFDMRNYYNIADSIREKFSKYDIELDYFEFMMDSMEGIEEYLGSFSNDE